MTKLIWLSDLHFTAKGDVLGHDPRVRLKAAIAFINTHHADASHCIISGDMVDHGTPSDYAALANQLSDLNIPILPMAGNHDNRTQLRAHFDLPDTALPDFIQYSVETPTARLLCLDTQKEGADAGEFCPIRTNWLDLELSQHPDTSTYLFMHHPPAPIGLPMQDTDRMENGDAFLSRIAQHDNIKHLFIGHVHRPITGTMHGIPFSSMRSVLYQAPDPDPNWKRNAFTPAQEAPQLGVLTLNGADCHLHYTQFCNYQTGT